MKLLELAQSIVSRPARRDLIPIPEITSVYKKVFNITHECSGCMFFAMYDQLERFVENNKPNSLTIMLQSKYKFKEEFKNTEAVLAKEGISVTAKTLTDETAKLLVKNKLGHLLDGDPKLSDFEEGDAEDDDNELSTARTRYEELYGEKAGNKRLATLQALITKKESESEGK